VLNNSTNTATTTTQNDTIASQQLPPKTPLPRRNRAAQSLFASSQVPSGQITSTKRTRSRSTRGTDRAHSFNTEAKKKYLFNNNKKGRLIKMC
jgi:hypothetical protein